VADYAIGDIQGCYDALMRLLKHIDYQDSDRLWFVGDLVNRGPDSLKVLRFIKNLPLKSPITLGNHDLHLLAAIFTKDAWRNADDTLHAVLAAEDAEELGHWLLHQPILVHDAQLNVVMTHAGIAPMWSLDKAKSLALELETVLRSSEAIHFLSHMYGNEPHRYVDSLEGIPRLRTITNYFTRMRFCDEKGGLNLSYKGTVADAPSDIIPWFLVPNRLPIEADIVFGHWAALKGVTNDAHIHAIDTGCLWGGKLTALRLQDKQRFSI